MQKRGAINAIKKYVRAANYISAVQIYLQHNFLLEQELTFNDIKPRLLGHWGTCPGINFVYANLQYLIKKHNLNMMFVLGPGHGYPALQANLFIEGSLATVHKQATVDKKGLEFIGKQFSWPYGFPSHSNPETPGVILEGGELGYSLSTSYGAVLDNPDLIVACVVGDGEAETGPMATAWHAHRFINPATNGVVLPILHLNGYKISGPTLLARMSNKELTTLFKGYGYEPFIVEGNKVYERMHDTLETCYKKIRDIKRAAAKGKVYPSRFPMIILRTPKGWTGIKTLHGEKIEGNFLSHQVVGKNAKSDPLELAAVKEWFESYNFNELFDAKKGICDEIKKILPIPSKRMGQNKHAYSSKIYKPLKLPDPKLFEEDAHVPGTIGSSSMRQTGAYLEKVFANNKSNIRFFSPDETYSNKLDALFNVTQRALLLPTKPWDKDISTTGKVIEMLSEHTLQGLMQGYVLTGRHAFFASYEAFIEIVSSMADQYEKFLLQANKHAWRGTIPSFNYILTSSGWRQEHNGFSHQNPKFISGMLDKGGNVARVFFPADANACVAVVDQCLRSSNCINIIVAGKRVQPRWQSLSQARKTLKEGMCIWDTFSDKNPDVVFVGIGDYTTKEAVAASQLCKTLFPTLRVRVVNVIEATSLGFGNSSKELDPSKFNKYFTKDRPVIFNYHGYPNDIKALLLYQHNPSRFRVNGYSEHGSTTTPFDMHVRNNTDRYHLVIQAIELLVARKRISQGKARSCIKDLERKLKDHRKFIIKNGVDPQEIEQWDYTQ